MKRTRSAALEWSAQTEVGAFRCTHMTLRFYDVWAQQLFLGC